jgi:MFS family permease
MSYQSSFLTDVLRKEKNISEMWNGLILALPLSTCFIGCILVNPAAELISRRILILVSFILLGFSMFMQGPSLLLNLPDWNVLFLIGFAINGFAQGFIFIPLLPDALEAVYIK